MSDLRGRLRQALARLAEVVPLQEPPERSPFERLVATVLSQNTSGRNTARGMERLRARLPITPGSIAQADPALLEECLRPCGLWRSKAGRLRELARRLAGGRLEAILGLSTPEARRELLALPGVGPKTADVVLAAAGHPVLPVDTHVLRIGRRWGLGSTYREVQEGFHRLVSPQQRWHTHLRLIAFGRSWCRARGPRCRGCPLGQWCPAHSQGNT